MEELVKAETLLEEVAQLEKEVASLSRVCQKLSRKINSDASFLRKKSNVESDAPSSSNLPFLSGVLEAVKGSDNVSNVICEFRQYGITVDVVCDSGKTWKKVIARNPQSLHLIWAGKGQYGTRDVVKKAEKYVLAAKRFCEISPPEVIYIFCNGVTHQLAEAIESLGIVVEGQRVGVTDEVLQKLDSVMLSDSGDSDDDQDLFERARQLHLNNKSPASSDDEDDDDGPREIVSIRTLPSDEKIFLDITTMLAYVSDICHGGKAYNFKEKVLAEQANQEKEKPALDAILPHLNRKTLITCRSALDSFTEIVGIMGGPGEKSRTDELTSKMTVVPDCVSERYSKLRESGQVRHRSKAIFGTADNLKCAILTSNEGFVRAVAGQGVHVSCVLHQPRALSELKRPKFTDGLMVT